MSTKFFTNSNENTLPEKFKGVFTYSKVAAFDALVGYFRTSGYFRIREYLKDVQQIRKVWTQLKLKKSPSKKVNCQK
jgi:hypothetical protein